MHKIAITAALLLTIATATQAQNLQLTFKGIRSPKGNIMLVVFKDAESFENDKQHKRIKYPQANIFNGTMAATLNLEPGTYGLSILDDENGNTKMDYNVVGMPKEGFGFSNYYHKGLTRPKFESFKIEVKDQSQKVELKLRYL